MADLLQKTVDNEEDDMKDKFLIFLLETEIFGIELKNVMEIVGIQPITKMPEMPAYRKGVINLRGKITPVMDVRLRFKKPEKVYNDKTCIIVIDYDNKSIGLIVDCVSEVQTIREADIAANPQIGFGGSCGYVNGMGKIGEEVVLLIDCAKLLSGEELDFSAAFI